MSFWFNKVINKNLYNNFSKCKAYNLAVLSVKQNDYAFNASLNCIRIKIKRLSLGFGGKTFQVYP